MVTEKNMSSIRLCFSRSAKAEHTAAVGQLQAQQIGDGLTEIDTPHLPTRPSWTRPAPWRPPMRKLRDGGPDQRSALAGRACWKASWCKAVRLPRKTPGDRMIDHASGPMQPCFGRLVSRDGNSKRARMEGISTRTVLPMARHGGADALGGE